MKAIKAIQRGLKAHAVAFKAVRVTNALPRNVSGLRFGKLPTVTLPQAATRIFCEPSRMISTGKLASMAG
jgi:hypothetical protein